MGSDTIESSTASMMCTISTTFQQAALKLETAPADRYMHYLSGGIQEWIEAISFQQYLQHQTLLTLDQANQHLHQLHPLLVVSPQNYVLGIADLSGEVMRLALNAVGKGQRTVADQVRVFLQDLYASCLLIDGKHIKEWTKKMDVMQSSLAKVEKACFEHVTQTSEVIPNKRKAAVLDGP
jgi:predicted translin family RNA/ssDNA-binding protein